LKNRKLSFLLSITMLLTVLNPSFGAGSAFASESGPDTKPTARLSVPVLQHPDTSKFNLNSSGKKTFGSRPSLDAERTGYDAEPVTAPVAAERRTIAKTKNFVPESLSSNKITVIVELQSDPVSVYEANVKQGFMKASGNHQSRIAHEQASFSAALMETFGVQMNRTFSKVFNGGSLTIPANQVGRLLDIPGVKAVYPSHTYTVAPIHEVRPMMNHSAPHIGADAYWDSGFDGSGIKVGIIDSGIDYNHPSLKDAYKGGYDFVDNDADPMETPPDPGNPNAATDHGTHVSGTVAGRGNPEDPDSPTGWVRGVAPGADLYVYRVLGPGGVGSSENEIAAIERAVEDGLDVINISMGGGKNDQYSADSIAANNAALAGLVVVAASGNTGPGEYTTQSPAVSEMAITVGAATSAREIETITGKSSVTASTYYTLREMAPHTVVDYSKTLLNQPLELVYVNLGYPADFESKNMTGKAALIKRGEIKYVEKIANAKRAGAAAVFLFNQDDQDGFTDGLVEDSPDYIPAFDMKGTDGRALLSALQTAGSGTFTLTGIDKVQVPGDVMADFSSRGPSLPGYEIKPDVVAPGVSIRSSIPAPHGNYQYAYTGFDGTSMAAPHVAGAAALILDKRPELEPDEVKSLLMNTAVKLEKPDHTRNSFMEQGAGRVDLNAALEAKAVAMVRETTDATDDRAQRAYYTGSISFGEVKAGTSVSRTIDVKDIAGESSSFAISTVWYGTGAGSLTTSMAEVELVPGGTSSFDITLYVPSDTPPAGYEGEIILAGADAVLNIPVAVYVPDIISGVALNPDIFSPNEDSNLDTSNISFHVQFDNQYISLDVHDGLTGDWIGVINEEEAGLPPGFYTIEDWNGRVFDSGAEFTLPDGYYVIVPWVGDGGEVYAIDSVAPFIIDTNEPDSYLIGPIAVDGSTGTILGQIGDDLLIDIYEDYSAIYVEARYKENDDTEIIDGTIADDGTFEIAVPLRTGENKFEIYVYDEAGNGNMVPSHIVTYTLTPASESGTVSIAPSKSAVNTKEAFTIDVKFAEVQELYSAQFSLTYDSKLTKGGTVPGVTMDVYQRQQMPGSSLIVKETVLDLGNGLMRSDYVISMAGEINGYSGVGTLAAYHFGADHPGEYTFQLSNLRMLNSRGEEINPRITSGATVKVIQNSGGGGGPIVYNVTGSIRAQGLGDDVDYSSIWYEGADGKLQVVVDAVNGQGSVVRVGTVNEDGTYMLSVPAGNYTIRVQVPGHTSASQSVVVDKHVTVNFELGHIAAGDVTGDSIVDLLDLNRVARAFGKSAPWTSKAIGEADLNRDRIVNMLDVSFILGNYSTGP